MEEKVLLDVQIKNQEALEAYTKLTNRISELRQEQAQLKKQGLENSDVFRQHEQEIKALSKRAQDYTREIQNQIKVEHNQNADRIGSMQQMKAQLSLETQAFNNLTKAEREADLALGRSGMDSYSLRIKNLTTQLNEAEQELLNFRRNVGNYEGAIRTLDSALAGLSDGQKALLTQTGLLNSGVGRMVASMSQLGQMFSGGVTQGIQQAGQAIGTFGKQMLALLANPIVATLALIAGAFMAMSEAIKSDEDASNALQRVLAPLQGIFDGIVLVLQKTTEGILYVVEGFDNLAMSASRLAESLPLIGGAFKSMNKAMDNRLEAVKAQQEAEAKSRDMLISSAETENKVAKLRTQVAQKDKYTSEERRKFLEQAIALERKEAEEQVRLAKMRLRALQLETENTKNNAETKRRLAEATAEVTKADTNFYNVTLRLQKQLSTFNAELKSDAKTRSDNAKKSAEDARNQAKERADKEREAIRKEEDTTIALIVNQYDQRRQTINLQYSRQIEDLRLRLEQEKNLTIKAREAINQTIINLEQKRTQELEKIGKDEVDALNKTLKDLQALTETSEAKKAQGVISTYAKAQEEAQKQINALQERLGKGTASAEEEEALYQLLRYSVELEKAKQKELDTIARESNAKRIKELETAISNEGAIALADYSKTEVEKYNIMVEQSRKRIELYKKELESTTDQQTRLELQKKIATEEQTIRQNTLKAIQAEEAKELANTMLTATEKYRIKQEYLDKELEAVRGNADAERAIELEMIANRKEYIESLAQSIDKFAGQATEAMNSLSTIMNNNGKKEVTEYKKAQDKKKTSLKDRLDKGLISEEQYNAEVLRIDEATAKKEAEIQIAQAKRAKAIGIMSAIINTATAIMRIWADVPKMDFGASTIALTAMASALGALQVATIASEPLPTAGSGMMIKGADHAHGGVIINAEGGEAIINKKATQRFLPLLSRINQSTGGVPLYGAGGIAGLQSMQASMEAGIDYEALAEACASIPVYTAVTDINRGQARVAKIIERKTY